MAAQAPDAVHAATPGTVARRALALALDLTLLFAGLLLVFGVGLSLTNADVALWVIAVWVLLVAPLYFALYHAFGGPEGGPGATPGQHEFGICVRDAGSGERVGLWQALSRSYGGLLAAFLVVPLFADLLSLAASSDDRAWHDRLSRSTVSVLPEAVRAPKALQPTAAGLEDLFVPGRRPGTGQWRRAGRLVRSRPRALIGPPFLVYLGLLVIATVLIPLLIADFGGDLEQEAGAAVYWLELALLLFVSGVYWTQAVMVTAVDAVRTGERIHLFDAVRRASVRVNGLTVALVLLAAMVWLSVYTLFVLLVVVARFGLVVPAIVLEDDRMFGAFRRSWRLTRRLTGQAFVFFLGSALTLVATVGVALGIASWIVSAVVSDAGIVAYALACALALLLVSVPVSCVLAVVGAAWCFFYYDARERLGS